MKAMPSLLEFWPTIRLDHDIAKNQNLIYSNVGTSEERSHFEPTAALVNIAIAPDQEVVANVAVVFRTDVVVLDKADPVGASTLEKGSTNVCFETILAYFV